eukprot:TRINITY_DN13801_c0_g1_i1.p1 TRINITY_DN13801_c0_g1~~TRINITY_DN13801_c0_g1_i1.p1  ORF type:complete len:176 (+),score=11.89 TRINITY_DN13801_c0_g1_i1:288-815(+)
MCACPLGPHTTPHAHFAVPKRIGARLLMSTGGATTDRGIGRSGIAGLYCTAQHTRCTITKMLFEFNVASPPCASSRCTAPKVERWCSRHRSALAQLELQRPRCAFPDRLRRRSKDSTGDGNSQTRGTDAFAAGSSRFRKFEKYAVLSSRGTDVHVAVFGGCEPWHDTHYYTLFLT